MAVSDDRQHSIWRPLLLLAALTAAAGCSSDTAAPAPAVLTTTTLAVTTTTTAAPTTTVPPVTATTEDPEIAAVRAAHLAYLAMFELVGDPPNPDHPELALRATGDAYDRLRANLAQARLRGSHLSGEANSSIETVTIENDKAVVVDCLLDALAEVGSTGETLIPADGFRARVRTHLVRREAGWLVELFEVPAEVDLCGS